VKFFFCVFFLSGRDLFAINPAVAVSAEVEAKKGSISNPTTQERKERKKNFRSRLTPKRNYKVFSWLN
jgi:hypothetical protein